MMELQPFSPEDQEILRWIFIHIPDDEFALVCASIQRYRGCGRQIIIQAARQDRLFGAALCIRIQDSQTAQIVGLRFAQESPQLLSGLLESTINALRLEGVQRLGHYADCAQRKQLAILEQLGFSRKCEILQLWRSNQVGSICESGESVPSLEWSPLTDLSSRQLHALVDDCHADSLDGPRGLGTIGHSSLESKDSSGKPSFLSGLDGSICKIKGEAVGCLLRRLAGKGSEIVFLGVVPAWRRQGVGNALLTRELRAAAVAQSIIVAVDAQNLPALRLYAKHEFRPYSQMDYFEKSLA